MEESRDENQGKIRKRGCSSSTSSSLVRKSRFKRAILVGKRFEVGTPVTTPKMVVSRSPRFGDGTELLKFPTSSSGRNCRDGVVSARRLAATLWEINEVSSPPMVKKSTRASFSDPARDALPEVVGSVSGKISAPESQRIRHRAERDELLVKKPRKTRPGFKDVCKALETAKELLKVLSGILGVEDWHFLSANSIISAIRLEVDGAIEDVDRMGHERRAYRKEVKSVMQRLAEERVALRAKVRRVAAELEAERRMRRHAERVNRKLGRELADGKARMEELEREREWRARVEELKRASTEVEMLQGADALREEMVQMKIAEAKFEFEERNADLEKLRIEMDAAYMINDGQSNVADDDLSDEDEGLESRGSDNCEALRDFLRKTLGKVCENPNIDEAENDDREPSATDMHLIDLELEGIRKKSFGWIASPPSTVHDDSKRSSVEVFKGRKSLSEKIQWASISLLKGGSATKDDTTAGLQPQNDETHNEFQKPRPAGTGNGDWDDETNEHKSAKSLKQQILSSFRLGSTQGCTGPALQWGLAKVRS